MREDMMRKKREIMNKGGGGASNVKVEIVGLDFMQPAVSNEDQHDMY
jgi:hypothetical protein